jgi:tetratricopeptide (TPR) repeat protein
VIDRWIASGAKTWEPAVAALALMSMPPDVAVYDDVIARANHPPIAQLYWCRGTLLAMYPEREADATADLERAYELGDNYLKGDVRYIQASNLEINGDLDKAITYMYEAVELARDDLNRNMARGTLASWLEKTGDSAAAIAILADLAASGTSPLDDKNQYLARIAKIHIKSGDFAAAEATCQEMTGPPVEAMVGTWFEIAYEDKDPARIDRAIAAIAKCWSNPALRENIQSRARFTRTVRQHLVAKFDAALRPLAVAGLAESREIEDKLLGEPEGHAVLADELTRRGDPRGELIIVQQKLESSPDDAALLEREKQIIAENSFRLLGPLDPDKAKWRRGYVIRASHDILSGDADECLADIGLIASHPSLRFLEELTIDSIPDPQAALLDAAPGLRTITKLVVRVGSYVTLDRAKFAAALPNLEFGTL